MSDVIEINAETGEVVVRDYTNKEILYRNNMERPADPIFDQTEFLNYLENKNSALTKLQSLGLTTDEAKAIVGL